MHDVPENLLYSKDHEWIEIDGDIGTIGISDHAQAELSDVVFVDLPEVGATLSLSWNLSKPPAMCTPPFQEKSWK